MDHYHYYCSNLLLPELRCPRTPHDQFVHGDRVSFARELYEAFARRPPGDGTGLVISFCNFGHPCTKNVQPHISVVAYEMTTNKLKGRKREVQEKPAACGLSHENTVVLGLPTGITTNVRAIPLRALFGHRTETL